MPIKPLNRRTVLRGLLATGAAVAVPLPLLEIMLNQNGTALAQSVSYTHLTLPTILLV